MILLWHYFDEKERYGRRSDKMAIAVYDMDLRSLWHTEQYQSSKRIINAKW